jgi:pyruvate formate lyase activating enzyme
MAIVKTKYWQALESGKIQCDLCPRECKLSEGQRGLCYVRGREDDGIVLYTYGRSSGFCVDPIEKKPLNHYLPGTPVLSFGTAGCNLSCKFCQNWDISKSREMDTLQAEASPEAIVKAAKNAGCKSIAFTYNDPVIFLEYAKDVAEVAHQNGLKTVAVTAGFIKPEPRKEFYSFIDAANIDLKAFTNDFYQKVCGGELAPVLDTLIYLKNETNVWFEITTLLIPGQNDSPDEIDMMLDWILKNLGPDIPLHFTAFHPDYKMTDNYNTPHETLNMARDMALAKGIHFCYVGNVHDAFASSTYCPKCEEILIERDWYQLGRWGLDEEGACHLCGEKLAGVFEKVPGTWGPRRLPLHI